MPTSSPKRCRIRAEPGMRALVRAGVVHTGAPTWCSPSTRRPGEPSAEPVRVSSGSAVGMPCGSPQGGSRECHTLPTPPPCRGFRSGNNGHRAHSSSVKSRRSCTGMIYRIPPAGSTGHVLVSNRVPFTRLSRLIGAGTVYSKGCFFRRFFHGEELTMSEPRTPAEGAPPAETVKEHVKQTGEDKNLGAGDEEPDPATADAPPSDIGAGDEKRTQT